MLNQGTKGLGGSNTGIKKSPDDAHLGILKRYSELKLFSLCLFSLRSLLSYDSLIGSLLRRTTATTSLLSLCLRSLSHVLIEIDEQKAEQ